MQLIKQISKRIIWILIGVLISCFIKPKEAPESTISFKTVDSLKVELSVKDSLLNEELLKRDSLLNKPLRQLKEAKTTKDTIYIYKEILEVKNEVIKQDSIVIKDFIEIVDLRDSIIFNQEAVIQNQIGIITQKDNIIAKQNKQIKRLKRMSFISSSIAIIEGILIVLI